MKKIMSLMLFLGFLTGVAHAQEPLTADQVKELFSNKSFDIHNLIKDKRLQGYADAEGKHFIYIPWKDKISKRKWWIEGNKHCTSHPKRGDSCKEIIPAGNGVYHGITDGDHTHTLSNFREGRHIDQ